MKAMQTVKLWKKTIQNYDNVMLQLIAYQQQK